VDSKVEEVEVVIAVYALVPVLAQVVHVPVRVVVVKPLITQK
jgi:hypothetical protein